MKNKYINHTKISEEKFRQILNLFCIDIEASKVAEITQISRQTINRIFLLIRKRIQQIQGEFTVFSDENIEVDESYFGAKRVRGKRGRGAGDKTKVFGMLKRQGKVYVQVVENCSAKELLPIILEHSKTDARIFSDGWKSYDGLVDFGYKKHYRVKHCQEEYAAKNIEISGEKMLGVNNHINGIENFWGLCKVRLSRFRGIKKSHFLLHLKECEFRYNNRDQDLYKILLKNFRQMPLILS